MNAVAVGSSLTEAIDIQIISVNEQVESIERTNALLVQDNEDLHDQIAAAQKKVRANLRTIDKNEKAASRLRKKREIASAAARAILDVDQP